MRHVFRLTSAVGLFVLLLTGCDSGDPESDDLYRLDPIGLNAYVSVPEYGDQSSRIFLALPFTFEIPAGELEPGSPVEFIAQSAPSLDDALQAAGYSWSAVRSNSLSASGTLTLVEPAGATFEFLQNLRLDIEVGSQRSPILDFWYPAEDQFEIHSLYFQQEWMEALRDNSLRARLSLQARDDQPAPSTATYTIELLLQVEVVIGTAAPAPDGFMLRRDVAVRSELNYRGVSVADVDEARIETVRLVAYPPHHPANTIDFAERFRGVEVRIALPGGEGVFVTRLDRFERNSTTGEVIAVAEANIDVTSLVRRSSELELQIELDLNEAAAARGEYYTFQLSGELIVEVPLDALDTDTEP